MTAVTTFLQNVKQRDWAIIFIVLSFVGAGLWYWFMYRPTQDTIAEREAEIARLDVQIERGEAARRNLPALRAAVAELELDRQEFLRQLPRESEVANLVDDLRLTASAADVTLNSVSQSGPSDPVPDVRSIGFTLATSAPFAQTMGMLGILETLQRYTKISSLSMSVGEQADDPELSSSFSFTVYVFTGDDPGDPIETEVSAP